MDLKPCPFCGSSDLDSGMLDNCNYCEACLGFWRITCRVCGVRGPTADEWGDAVKYWNLRGRRRD